MGTRVAGERRQISIRLAEADIVLIDRAAGLRGQSRSEFIREAAVQTAEDTPVENRTVRLSPEGFAEFVAALEGPPVRVPEMLELLQRRAPWETTEGSKR
jgi:uncharacterized protein (DUF1778 family)